MCEVFDVLLADDCGSNMGGTKLKVHIAAWGDILTFGTVAASPTLPQDGFIITSPHVFKTGKSWKTMMITKNSGVNNISPGGANSGAKNYSFVFQQPSKNMTALALFNQVANGVYPVILLVEDANMPDGMYDQIGTSKIWATMTAEKINGTNDGDGSMYQFTVACVQPSRIIYNSTVSLTPAA